VRLLVIDQEEGFALDLVLRAVAAGHEVRWFIWSPKGKKIRNGEGFKGFTVVSDWRDSMPWVGKDGLVWMSGNCRFLVELDRYREFGFKIFGPTVASAGLEIKRSAGLEAMKAVGIEVPPYQEFASLEDAEAFARKSDKCWVFKTLGDEDDKSLSFVSKDPAELVGWIRQKIARGMKLKGPCLLQEKIDMLAEVGVSGWFGSDGFLPDRWQACIEHKKLCNDEIGPNTGESGTVTQYCENDKMADEMLKPMEAILRTLGHRGDFAIGAGIDKNGKVWPFEFTARAGWPVFFIQTASHRGDPIAWMMDALNGKDTLKVSYDIAIGVVCGIPMYPYGKSSPEMVEGNPIAGLDDVWPDAHPVGVMKGRGPVMKDGKVVEGPNYQTAGEYVMVCTGLGKTVEKARKRVYETVGQVKVPNMIFRTDIGQKVIQALPALHAAGYLLDMKAS
jgi:phosphoribosylamine--glycine ligase